MGCSIADMNLAYLIKIALSYISCLHPCAFLTRASHYRPYYEAALQQTHFFCCSGTSSLLARVKVASRHSWLLLGTPRRLGPFRAQHRAQPLSLEKSGALRVLEGVLWPSYRYCIEIQQRGSVVAKVEHGADDVRPCSYRG